MPPILREVTTDTGGAVQGAQIAQVAVATLRRLHGALIGESDAAEIDALILELAYLIECAQERGADL